MIIFFLIFLFFRFMYISVLRVQVCVCPCPCVSVYVYMSVYMSVYLCLWTTGMAGSCGGQKKIGSPGTGVVHGCEPPCDFGEIT